MKLLPDTPRYRGALLLFAGALAYWALTLYRHDAFVAAIASLGEPVAEDSVYFQLELALAILAVVGMLVTLYALCLFLSTIAFASRLKPRGRNLREVAVAYLRDAFAAPTPALAAYGLLTAYGAGRLLEHLPNLL